MITVFVQVGGKTESTNISEETYRFLREGSFLRQSPIGNYLRHIVEKYGALTEENILKFMEEKDWVL